MSRVAERARDGSLRVRMPDEGAALLAMLLDGLEADLGEGSPDQRRLFPAAYDDPVRESAFADLTHGYLIAAKRDAIHRVRDALDQARRRRGFSELALGEEATAAFLGAINDLRLVLGTQLGVTDDEQPRAFTEDDGVDAGRANAYLWLGGLQENVLHVLLSEISD